MLRKDILNIKGRVDPCCWDQLCLLITVFISLAEIQMLNDILN